MGVSSNQSDNISVDDKCPRKARERNGSEPSEWRIRQHSAEKNSPVNCFSRGKLVDLQEQGKQATENCFI